MKSSSFLAFWIKSKTDFLDRAPYADGIKFFGTKELKYVADIQVQLYRL